MHKEHFIQWRKPEINLMELANLRWIEKWSVKRLSNHFERKPNTISTRLTELKEGGLKTLNLTPKSFETINKASKIEFRGLD